MLKVFFFLLLFLICIFFHLEEVKLSQFLLTPVCSKLFNRNDCGKHRLFRASLSEMECSPRVTHWWKKELFIRWTLVFLVVLPEEADPVSFLPMKGSSVVCRVLPLHPLPARRCGVHTGPQAHGGAARPPRGRWDGCEHWPRSWLRDPLWELLHQRNHPEVGLGGWVCCARRHPACVPRSERSAFSYSAFYTSGTGRSVTNQTCAGCFPTLASSGISCLNVFPSSP